VTWRRVPLRRFAHLGSGHTPSRSRAEYWVDCTIPWFTLADVGQVRDSLVTTVYETKEKISEVGLANSAAELHPADTVVLSRTASVGFSAILGRPMATSQDFATWICGPLLDARYLLYALRGLQDEILGLRMGSTHQTIYMPDIERITIPLPPIAQQQTIVRYLASETDRVDSLIARRQRLIGLLDERVQTIINVAFGEVIVWSTDGIPMGIGDAPSVRLGGLALIQSGLTLDAGRQPDSEQVTRPYLRVANVQDSYVDFAEVKEVAVPLSLARRCELRAGDVLMTEGGDQDKLGRGTVWGGEVPGCLHQNHIFAVRPRSGLVPEYLAMLTRTQYARAYFEVTASKTTGIASTNRSKISAFRVPLPHPSVQRAIVASVTDRLADVERLRRATFEQLGLLHEHRRALISAAVTGQLDISGASAA
jgi:type I restriction enzyme, S subunit